MTEAERRLAADQRAANERRKQALNLQRENILSQRTSNPARRSALEAALSEIEAQISSAGVVARRLFGTPGGGKHRSLVRLAPPGREGFWLAETRGSTLGYFRSSLQETESAIVQSPTLAVEED